jgi:hypothetical protein
MTQQCNVCNNIIGKEVYLIYDKKHCSSRCKNYYKQHMEKRNFDHGELYYEKDYADYAKKFRPKSKSFPLIETSTGFFFENIVRKQNSVSCPALENPLMISKKVNIAQTSRKRPLCNEEMIEIVIHNPSDDCGENVDLRKGYLDKVMNMSIDMISYFRNFMCYSPKLIR